MTRLALMGLAGALYAAQPALVVDDFESGSTSWDGGARLSAALASHGRQSLRLALQRGGARTGSARIPHDWRGFERLLFDIHYERAEPATATVRIYEEGSGERYDAQNKIFLLQGWNHVEVRLTPLMAASYLREIDLSHIERIEVSFERTAPGTTVHLDNFRLVAGTERAGTASRTEPRDCVTEIDNRWVKVRQVAAPGQVPESAEVAALRAEARREHELLNNAIAAAELQGIPTIYAERRQVVADLGLNVRPLLAWFNNDEKKREMFRFVAETCRESRLELESRLRGLDRLGEADDTQTAAPFLQPFPPLKGRPIRDRFFAGEDGSPMMILSLHSPSRLLEKFFATPLQHIESYSVGGGSRWTIEQSPVYKAFHQDPDTHRVGWDGWCGHLIRDLSSMGGTRKENVVICLESPRVQEAVREYIRTNIPRFHSNPQLLYDIMAYELMYICYCDRSQREFRGWLGRKHGSVTAANEKWGTAYKSLDEVVAPPVKGSRPLPGTNRALWYDWARFNQDRFTDYLVKTRNYIRSIDPQVPLAAGGSSSMLAGRTGTTGIDEERIVNEVDDLIIHEGGGSTLGMDLQLALSEKKKPLADPELGLGGVEYLLPHFLHGKSVVQLYHWPAQPANEFHSNNASSWAHSWRHSLADVDELLRTAIDVRRLNREIAAFVEVPAEVAILYSQTSTLQLPPEMLTWQTTPYLAELQRTYEAAQYLDAKATFVTERQIRHGWLSRYKLLLIPGVRNLPAAVVEKVWEYAAGGGRVAITPESLLGDEYNRPQPYLEKLGIRILETRRPKPGSMGGMVQGYDQSFSQDVTFTDEGPVALEGGVEAEGVRQVIAPPPAAEVLSRWPDQRAAIVRVPLGRGSVVYSSAALAPRSYARLLERLFAEAAVNRPVRVRNLDGDSWKIEARAAPLGGRRLLYIANFNAAPVRVAVRAANARELHELRRGAVFRPLEATVPARQTVIYELK